MGESTAGKIRFKVKNRNSSCLARLQSYKSFFSSRFGKKIFCEMRLQTVKFSIGFHVVSLVGSIGQSHNAKKKTGV